MKNAFAPMDFGIDIYYRYPHWSGITPGTRIEWREDITGWKLTFLLLQRDDQKVILRWSVQGMSVPAMLRDGATLVLQAEPKRMTVDSESEGHRSRIVELKEVPSGHPAVASEEAPRLLPDVVTGEEVLTIGGEEWLCQWVEKRATGYGIEVVSRTWSCSRLPGTLARVASYSFGKSEPDSLWSVDSIVPA